MKKKIFYLIIPIAVLAIFYYSTKKSGLQLHGNFNRTFQSVTELKSDKKIYIHGIVDGITVDKQNLWINQRFNILKYNPNSKNEINIKGDYSTSRNPIVNLCVEHDSIFYYQGNTNTINFVDLTSGLLVKHYKLSFPISYFTKASGNSFIFEQDVPAKVYSQIHYKDFGSGVEEVNDKIFSHEQGSSIRYSGCFVSSADKRYFFFVPYYDDYVICMNGQGKLRYKFKAIDYQNQNLDIIREGQVYYLSPKASIIRLAACVFKDKLLLTSKARAQNQSEKLFKSHTTIDIYDITNGKYQFSFYLPKYHNYDPSNIAVSDNGIMFATYGSTILSYQLNL